MSSSPSAPASPSFSHAPLVNVPGPSRKVIAGPANMPDVERVGSSDEEGLGKGVGRGWLGDLDGWVFRFSSFCTCHSRSILFLSPTRATS